jgi:hypothetical protein
LKGIFYDGHLSKILKCPKYELFNRMTYKENILDKVRRHAFFVLSFTENKFKIHYQLAGSVTGSMLFHFSLI